MSNAYFSIVKRLEAIFTSLPADMLKALKAPTGRPGYGPEVLFRAYLATFVLNSSSISAGLRLINDDSALADIIGGTPTKYAICRFIARLKDTDIIAQVMAIVATHLRELVPDIGDVVAIDSSDIKAWSSYRRTDPDAQSSRKKGSNGRIKWWYGYKVHLVSDATHEIPLGAYVTPANESDMHQVGPSLECLTTPPTHVLADAGYDSAANRQIVEGYRGRIQCNRCHQTASHP
ncbi:MAG: transposase [Chloroflexi bacterium]|nr:transposase [Chloroflexota bacterium]MDA1271881.1 transposase [Chloroflexota bacterium]